MLGKKFQLPIDLHYKKSKKVLIKNILPGERERPMGSRELRAQDLPTRGHDDLSSMRV